MHPYSLFSGFLISVFLLTLAPIDTTASVQRKAKRRNANSSRKAPKTPAWPSFESRHAEWIQQAQMGQADGAVPVNPLAQYLVSEVIVTGIFQTDEGAGVFLYCTPTGNTFFATAGTLLYNGRVVSVTESSGMSEAFAVFMERVSVRGEERQVVKKIESPVVPEPSPVIQQP